MEPRAKVNIRDVAKTAQVSVATVSRVLNDKPGVGEATRERVLEVAKQLGFVPNHTARGLSGRRTDCIGFVVRYHREIADHDPFYSAIMVGAEWELRKHQLHLIPVTVGESADEAILQSVQAGRFDGFICAGPEISASLILRLVGWGYPTVLVDNRLKHARLSAVMSDDRVGAKEAVAHLISHGHQRIACLSGPLDWPSNRERYEGYVQAMQDAGAGNRVCIVSRGETTIHSGYDAMSEALQIGISAVFCANDAMALGAIRRIREANVSVPAGVAVVGFDDIFLAEHCDPPLTSVRVHKERMGLLAARRLCDVISGNDLPETTLVGCDLVVRSSCGCRQGAVGADQAGDGAVSA